MGNLTLFLANDVDASILANMQKKAFTYLYAKYNDLQNPANESPEKIIEQIKKNYLYYFIIRNNNKVGVIRILPTTENTAKISMIFVLPSYQKQGIAQQALKQIEELYANILEWHLDTIKEEKHLCKL